MHTSATGKWGQNGEEQAALHRVRTRPECPEGNQRELTRDSNLNCGRAKKREKINLQKAQTEDTASQFSEQRKD